ncbi:hypothetical protein F5Y13DRAFT_149547 [Hypoxylon sp. FL1857]|nr:hypothetical protein F5Y13DRAFT_149547 [Hypoxylon sp. FL1857]
MAYQLMRCIFLHSLLASFVLPNQLTCTLTLVRPTYISSAEGLCACYCFKFPFCGVMLATAGRVGSYEVDCGHRLERYFSWQKQLCTYKTGHTGK